MTQNQILSLVALGALAAYFYTRESGATNYSFYPGYSPANPETGVPYYTPGTLDDVYL